MFNIKLKERIDLLESRSRELNSKNIELSKEIKILEWKVNNPSKYKVGDKVNGFIVTNHKFNASRCVLPVNQQTSWPPIINIIPNHYSYTLTNIKTGQISERTEIELSKPKTK